MVNVGLREYLWEQKPLEEKLAREVRVDGGRWGAC